MSDLSHHTNPGDPLGLTETPFGNSSLPARKLRQQLGLQPRLLPLIEKKDHPEFRS